MGRRGVLEKKTISTLRKVLYDYIITTGISEIELDDALWRYSKLMCAVAPSNASTTDRTGASGEKSVLKTPDYSNASIVRRYAESCGRCVVNHLCTFGLGSGGYYSDDVMVPTVRVQPHKDPAALIGFTNDMLSYKNARDTTILVKEPFSLDHPTLDI